MIIALDLETTGLDNKDDKIIEVALVKFDENTFEIIEKYSTLVNPRIHIPELTSNITNIYDQDVKDAPYFEDIKQDIEEFIGDCPILGHNTYFDRDFLIVNGVDIIENVVLDTFFLSNFVVLGENSLSLESLSKLYNLNLEGAHRALNDTIATLKLFEKLVKDISKMSKIKRDILTYIFSKSNVKEVSYLRDFLELNYKVEETDILKKILSTLGEFKKSDDFYHNPEVEVEFKKEYFSKFDSFEMRDNQLKMSNIVIDSLVNNTKNVIEAPTGVGKTFAYLLPSILYSIKNNEQVYISTNTKALQDQIIYKDLNFLSENLDFDFSYTKLKGKRNYLGVNVFLDLLFDNINFDKSQVSFLSKMVLWIFKTKTGELDEISYYGDEFGYLREINADSFITLNEENEYRKYEYIYKVRQNSLKSNIVIINHSLLLQDLSADTGVLGKIDNLVIDEVHNLEDTATQALRDDFSIKNFEDSLNSIDRIIKKYDFVFPEHDKLKSSLILELSFIYESLEFYINSKVNYETVFKNVLIGSDFYEQSEEIILKLKDIELKILDFINFLGNSDDKCYLALSKDIKYLESFLETIKIIGTYESGKQFIKIASFNDRTGVVLSTTLLNPGEYLKEKLWKKTSSLVLTSATLRIGEDFSYISKILSLDESFNFSILDSDFDYSKQSLLFIPNDLGSIKNNSISVNNFLKNLFLKIKGRALVLFTSFASIKESYLYLNNDLKKAGTDLYAQSIGGSKHKLISFYKENSKKSILFGTDTFWEGIDIPGNDLEYLIIHKLPFMVPNDPVFKARSIMFKDSFREYSIPKSILKLRQGFGRLIRTKSDKGIVILLDDRVYSTRWGEAFYNAFPSDIKIRKGNSEDFLNILKS